jgi:hypothetical protein
MASTVDTPPSTGVGLREWSAGAIISVRSTALFLLFDAAERRPPGSRADHVGEAITMLPPHPLDSARRTPSGGANHARESTT